MSFSDLLSKMKYLFKLLLEFDSWSMILSAKETELVYLMLITKSIFTGSSSVGHYVGLSN